MGLLVRIHCFVWVGGDMVVEGGWRVWDSFCRREDAIYTELRNRDDGLGLCIRNHCAIDRSEA